ncbi:hypothetical protein LCGC14_0258930 [marine sediment metagenome]|uniref:Phage-like element PBSX protein XkdF domain-containing protein n=1 Tax=marine sediment metagenome TaxID=412755 RepID=A0A0F9X788_9ZZZZ
MRILKSLDPHYLVHRLASDQIVGVLADRDLGALADDDMMLADGEVDPDCEPLAHGVVRLRKGVRFASGEAAVAKLGEKLDPFMARTFGASADPVWFHPLKSVDAWEEAAVVKGLEVPVRILKAAEVIPDEGALSELSSAGLGEVAKLLDSNPESEGAEELAVIVKAEYDRRGLEPDESLLIFKGLWGYPAGKARLSKRLVEMMPTHKVYVEPFVGSGAVLFAKEKVGTEVVNDTDPAVAEAWQVLSELTAQDLKRLCGMNWTGDRDTFTRMKKETGGDDVVKLHRFFYLSKFAYGRWRGTGFSPEMQGHTVTMARMLEKNAPRAQGVVALHGDYEAVCRKYDGPDTLHFLDPPYAGYASAVGEKNFDEERFFKMLKELKGKWIVTYGVKGKLPKMLRDSGFTVKKVTTHRSIRTSVASTNPSAVLDQLIAYNFDPNAKAEDPALAPTEEPAEAPVEAEKKNLNSPDAEKQEGSPVLCFYHGDLDGVASAAVVLQAHPAAELASINYGQEFPWDTIKDRETVYMVDFGMQPFEEMVKLKAELDEMGTRFVWIDHHITALEAAEKAGFEVDGLREIGQAGCELTWKFIHPDDPMPEVVRLAGRFDVWDHEDPNVLPVHYAMEAIPEANDPSSEWWAEWLKKGEGDFAELVAQGKAIQGWLEEFSAGRMRFSSFDVDFAGLKCVAACTSLPGSIQFESVGKEHDAAISFCFSPRNQWNVSMYSIKEGVDVGKVCMDNGGGGHAGAGGFQCTELPFDLPASTKKAYDLREPLAAYAHDAWSRWMDHLFEQASPDGTMAPEDVERWKRLITTKYADLTEDEKESDRLEADRLLAVMSGRDDEVEKAAVAPLAPAPALAVFKPTEENSFDDVKELLEKFGTDESLGAGVGVGPKWNGQLAIVHSVPDGVSIHYEGNPTEQAPNLKAIAASAAKFDDGYALIGEVVEADIGAVFMARDVLHWAGVDHSAEPWSARQKILDQAVPQATAAIAPAPARLVHSADTLKAAITWAAEVPGSVGAVITPADSVATPGGSAPQIAEVRTPRIVNAMVVGADSNPDGSNVYQCAVGPLSDSESDRLKEVVEVGGRNYAIVGSVCTPSVNASVGDTLRVEVGEILVVDSEDSAAIGWDSSKVLERVHVKPATVSEVRALARPHEIQKLCKILKRDSERHYILSVVLEPNDGKGEAPLDPDAHNDIYSDDEIWDACVYWYEQGAGLGVMHERGATTSELLPVHNIIAPVDMEIGGEFVRAGSWLIGSLVLSADLWQRIESGELNAWSVDGRALRRPEAIAA